MSTADAVLRLAAWRQRRAQVKASRQQVTIAPHAWGLAPIKMAGEDVTIFAASYGALTDRPQFDFVADPRNRDDEYALFGRLGAGLAAYFDWCLRRGVHPQVWVASPAVVRLLDLLADRLRYGGDGSRAKPPEVIRFGEHLTHLTQRAAIPGSQTLICATEALSTHFVTGQQPSENLHLGSLLTWISPPDGVSLERALAIAECEPMGVVADPQYDNGTLNPRLEDWNRARRSRAPELRALTRTIGDLLREVTAPIFDNIVRTSREIQNLNLPPLSSLAGRVAGDMYAFSSFMSYLERPDHRFALRDRPLQAALGLLEREHAAADSEAETLMEDVLARSFAVSSGGALHGIVESRSDRVEVSTNPSGRRTRRTVTTLVLLTDAGAKVRRGDVLRWVVQSNLSLEVTDFAETPGGDLQVQAEVRSGMRSPGIPSNGSPLDLVASVPERWRFPKKRQKLRGRLQILPWPHDSGRPPPPPRREQEHPDPLGAVERLRLRMEGGRA